jgi:non-ribosomal peptide synthetase component E (peptide arylation enzyme)
VAAPDRRFGEVAAAYLVAKDGASVDTAVLADWLQERGAARQKAPVHWRVVDALPVNASGKVKKFELTASLASELGDAG